MKKEEIHLGDIKRWLFGQTPPAFMFEVCIRTVLIYLLLLLTVRLMGKRMTGQITLTELAIMVTLGAIVSPVMQLPDRGIIYGIVGLGAALFFQRGFNWLGFKSKKIEEVTQGTMSVLIKDGVLNLEEIEKIALTKQQVYSMLREKKVMNLGRVRRAYLEACGIFNVYLADENKPGLPTLPTSDVEVQDSSGGTVDKQLKACCNCGHVQHINNKDDKCELCNANEWSVAYMSEVS